jgi:hypothetical protein
VIGLGRAINGPQFHWTQNAFSGKRELFVVLKGELVF